MKARNHIIFWSFIFAAFMGFVFLFKSILLPFVLGIAVAYLLDPLLEKLAKAGLSRGLAALLILSGFVVVVFTFFAMLIPVFYREAVEFSADFPAYIEHIAAMFEPFSKHFQSLIGHKNGNELQEFAKQHVGAGFNIANHLLHNLAAGGQAALDVMYVAILTPIVSYFVMKEWAHINNWMEGLMPRDHKKTIKALLREIDQKLSGFVRGQISVAFVLGLAYAIALSLVGLKYGFLIGITSGLLSIIPMLGSAVGFLVSITVAWFQYGEWTFVGIVAAIFLVGQFIEGNVLTPKLVGGSVGLHPLWVFFALLAGGSLFGIVGMLLAVPVAAVAGVLIAFGISRYKVSSYFRGSHGKQKKPKQKNKGVVKKRKNAK